ncbi:acyltransferase family protein [Lysinibacter cavernae]|uniref:Peptidoglycan/LPS O-acetylase OafA/YrhL n=1 Tax=Lysinibacter cavernae TaxID=1640652 RepID=A0A7X5R3W4_9MICO|nr:acyltransferase [Lysinibacter cavernae]NIH55092.1 peptidoglycan/LPS O-acetylase OafA/YrhL [Lysinibacter cavernae]
MTTASKPKRYLGRPFDQRNNSLNLIRLLLALLVLFAHTYFLIGAGPGPLYGGIHYGTWAVAGFFVISGYLITGSTIRNPLGSYLLNRAARIVPGYYVCLIMMVAFFAPIGYFKAHGTLGGYLTTGPTPFDFLLENFLFRGPVYPIAGTPSDIPWPDAWNGSLWTLYYELICYMIIAFLCLFVFIRKSPWAMLVLFLGSVVVCAYSERLSVLFQSSEVFLSLATLVPYFLGGALLYFLSKWIGMHLWVGLGSVVITLACMWFIPTWGGQIAAPFMAYALLWISSWLPQPTFVKNNDMSYGTYIYAFPVQQMLAVFGLSVLGSWAFTAVATVITLPLAYASWRFVERPMMRRARRSTAVLDGKAKLPVALDDGEAVAKYEAGEKASQPQNAPQLRPDDSRKYDMEAPG